MIETELPSFNRNEFDVKKYRKSVKKKFEKVKHLCRFSTNKDNECCYDKTLRGITSVLLETLSNDSTYNSGNIYFILSVFDVHFNYLNSIYKRFSYHTDQYFIDMCHDFINEKNAELLTVLQDNKRHPVDSEQILKFMKESE